MDREVQMLALIIVGIMGVLASYNHQLDAVQVCIAGIIGFIGGKSVEVAQPGKVYSEPVKDEKIVEEDTA